MECEKKTICVPAIVEDPPSPGTTIRSLILAGRAADVRLVWEVDTSGEVGPARFAFQLGSQGEPCFRP